MIKGRRSEITQYLPWTGNANVSPQIRSQLKEFWPDVELIQNAKGQVVLYTVLKKGATSSDDLLIKEFRLQFPPNQHLITYLMAHDKYKRANKAGVRDPNQFYYDQQDREYAAKDLEDEKDIDEFCDSVTAEVKYKCKRRVTFDFGRKTKCQPQHLPQVNQPI